MKKKLVAPFITFLALFLTGISGLIKGIEHHETWRIVLASTGLAGILFMIAILAKKIFEKEKQLSIKKS
jgi:hypothetical protein